LAGTFFQLCIFEKGSEFADIFEFEIFSAVATAISNGECISEFATVYEIVEGEPFAKNQKLSRVKPFKNQLKEKKDPYLLNYINRQAIVHT
jgi:hypothetical protein